MKKLAALPVLIIIGALLFAPVHSAIADHYDDQMNALRAQNAQAAANAAALQDQEKSLADVVLKYQIQIAALETQIQQNQTKRDQTNAAIADAEAKLQAQQTLLGQDIKAIYQDGDTSTLEMLASSHNLSDFVDKEEYRTAVSEKITDTVHKINALKAELEAQKATLEKLLADQQAMQSQLDGQRAEQQRLLSMNQDQQAAYNQQIATNNSQISQLRRQQVLDNARFMGAGARMDVPDATGYPWSGAPWPNSIPDPWGMYERQCVSYTAWKVWKSGRFMPYWGGVGNANQWDDNARSAGIPVDGSPRVGDIAVSNRGAYGHVMYVEAVYGDGTIYISQYNAGWDGRYSEARIAVGDLVFIHF
ncbi:MAG TPA: CHAP domain-containing protein [Candidatus Saccharimonadales bacterium]|nr:CHAP domain-containing protein [Candidatus Saccharimonadales bacterium]